MKTFLNAVARGRLLAEQEERIAALTKECEALRRENERLKAAARRCVTCDYRIEIRRQRSEHKLLGRSADAAPDDDDEQE